MHSALKPRGQINGLLSLFDETNLMEKSYNISDSPFDYKKNEKCYSIDKAVVRNFASFGPDNKWKQCMSNGQWAWDGFQFKILYFLFACNSIFTIFSLGHEEKMEL